MMKKIILLAAVAALFTLTSCQKDGSAEVKDPVFKASISSTKTALNPANGKISWVEGDEVSITDNSSQTAIYVASEVSGSTATLTKKSGPTLDDGPYTAVYGTAPSTTQTYRLSAPSMPMSANANTKDDTFDFHVTCGLLELTLTKPGESIKSIAVSDGTKTYTLTCSPAVSIATGRKFYLALPAGDYYTFSFTNASDVVCVKQKSGTSVTVSDNGILPLSFASSIDFGTSFPAGTLGGAFSVAADKKVRFSSGNLQYRASTGTWRFAENQYDFIGDAAGNTTPVVNRASQSDWIDLFGWGATGRTEINPLLLQPYETDETSVHYKVVDPYEEGETLTRSNGGDWGVCIGDGWRLLTADEWLYLISTRSSLLRIFSQVEVAPAVNVFGVLVMPDGWTGEKLTGTTNLARWTELEAEGGVFFPAAGFRNGLAVSNAGTTGYYLSSKAVSASNAYDLFFKNGTMNPNNTIERHYGASVRLVME